MNRDEHNQVPDRHAMLLLYEAEELSPAQRLRVEHALAGDAGLRRELQELRAVQAESARLMAALDDAQPVPGSAAAAGRQFGRSVRLWHAEQLARAGAQAPTTQLRFPWWTYPLATAAAITIAVAAWWQTMPPPRPESVASNPSAPIESVIDDVADEEIAQYADAGTMESLSDLSGLTDADAEAELAALRSLRENWSGGSAQ